jgi:hypothetical protein
MLIVAVGFALLVARTRRTLLRPEGFELRGVLLITLAALVLLIPPWALDTLRGIRGLPFDTQQGRFLTPAYPGLAVIAVLALRELTRGRRRAYPASVGVFVAAAFVFYWHTWFVWVLERFYGAIDGHWLRALRHASYDKPTFITQDSLAAILIAAALAFIAAYLVTLRGALPRRGAPADDGLAVSERLRSPGQPSAAAPS